MGCVVAPWGSTASIVMVFSCSRVSMLSTGCFSEKMYTIIHLESKLYTGLIFEPVYTIYMSFFNAHHVSELRQKSSEPPLETPGFSHGEERGVPFFGVDRVGDTQHMSIHTIDIQ